MAQVRQTLSDVEFRMAILGDGPDREALQKQIEESNLQDTVRLTGFQNNAIAWYRSADVFVLPSLIEGMPNVLLEAMACGTAVISTDCQSGPAEILNNGQYGTLIPTDSVSALRDSLMAAVISSESLQIAALAQTHIANHWSAKAAAERLGDVLRRCAAKEDGTPNPF